MVGPVEKKEGRAAPWKKRTARCRDDEKSGVGFGSSSGGKGLKIFLKQVIGNAI
jgi:hypothetical protein